MGKSLFAFALAGVAAGDDVCCYMGCSQKPASCNPVGQYCSLSSDNCVNNCAGEWCPDSPSPPSPTPTPPPPTPTPSGATYCPDPSNDFFAEYGNVQWSSSGWTIYGNARVSSKASLNLVGGFLEFDMELSGAHGGVNNNLYATFPQGGNQGIGSYCDSGGSCSTCCAEMDFTENNGHCFQATTWHTARDGSDHDGTAHTGSIGTSVHIRADWTTSNSLSVSVDGRLSSGDGFSDVMAAYGAVLYSSQWTGWVPGSCSGDGDLAASSFTVSNLRIQGSVVQGPEPTKCSGNYSVSVV